MSGKELAPRFKRNLISTNQDSVENLQMRPAANSLLFKATSQNNKLPSMLPISTPPNGSLSNATPSTGGGFGSTFNQNKESQLSNAQYPLLGTPTSHLSSSNQQNSRPSSTPSAETEHKNTSNNEKNLKNTSSNPNFSSNSSLNQRNTEEDNNSEKKSLLNTPQVQLVTKQGSTEKANGASGGGQGKQQKKEKAFNKEEVLKKAAAYIKEKFFYTQEKDEITETTEENANENETTAVDKQLNDVVEGFVELKIPEKCMKDVCISTILDVLEKADEQYLDRVLKFLQTIKKRANLKPNLLLEVFKQVVKKMNEREALNPRITTFVANLLAKATVGEENLLKLNDIANYTDNGQHYPLFLLVLQQLHKTIGKDQLEEKFRISKVDLMNCLPEADRNKTRLAEILDDRSLTFLYPLLKVQAEMNKQLTSDPDPTNFYKWIKANVDAKYYKEEGFISALMTVVVKYVTSQTSFPEGTDVKVCPDKATIQKEESLLHKYCQILKSFLGHSIELQLIAIYALQVFCVNENFPKGIIVNLYLYSNLIHFLIDI